MLLRRQQKEGTPGSAPAACPRESCLCTVAKPTIAGLLPKPDDTARPLVFVSFVNFNPMRNLVHQSVPSTSCHWTNRNRSLGNSASCQALPAMSPRDVAYGSMLLGTFEMLRGVAISGCTIMSAGVAILTPHVAAPWPEHSQPLYGTTHATSMC